MSDKGGKGNLAKGGKSALKSPVGNGDSSTRLKKGKKVQFDSEESLESYTPNSNGKVSTPAAKGGKGDKVASSSKKSGKAPMPPVERRLEQDLPPDSVCLMDCEAAEILQSIHDQMIILSKDPDIQLPGSFDTGLTYAKRDGNFAKPQTVKGLFQTLKEHGVPDCEICMIANVGPDTADEVFALIPALKLKMNKLRIPLTHALGELAHLKEALANLKKTR